MAVIYYFRLLPDMPLSNTLRFAPPQLFKLNRSLFSSVVILSGFAGLGYQMVWSRMLAVSLGHEVAAVLAVVAAFFVGLAIGGFTLNNQIHKSTHPQRWYVGFELLIAAWSLVLIFIIPFYNQWTAQVIGVNPSPFWHWFVAFSASLLLLLPATFSMGATLPALERYWSGIATGSGSKVARLYALNTLGAVIGTLFTSFVLIQSFGLNATLLLLACCNCVCAAVLSVAEGQVTHATSQSARGTERGSAYFRKLLFVILFLTGLLGIGYEVIVVRLLSQILENTIYTFAAVLSVYLLGTAIGASVYQNVQKKISLYSEWYSVFSALLIGTVLSSSFCILCLYWSAGIYQSLWLQLGQGFFSAVFAELFVAGLVFFIPTAFMGALFSHLASRAKEEFGLGRALGVNTLGASIAPLLFGVVLLPLLGAKTTLVLLLYSYCCIGILVLSSLSLRHRVAYLAPLLCITVITLSPLKFQFIELPDGSRLLKHQEGVMATVAVVEDAAGHKHLKVNNHFTMGGTSSRFSDHRQTHIPLLLHGNASSLLYLGLGTGISFEAAQYYPNLSTTGVDLIPEVLPLISEFGVDVAGGSWSSKPKLRAADARRYILADKSKYDVIVGEIFHPSRDGAGALYTAEHFSAIKNRLMKEGVFYQWLPLFQLDIPTLKIIVRTFTEVFPNSHMYLGHLSLTQPILCLAGSEKEFIFHEQWLLNKVSSPALQRELVSSRLNSDYALFGSLLAAKEQLVNFSKDAKINTDNHPVVSFQAPHFVYSSEEPADTRLLRLIDSFSDGDNLFRYFGAEEFQAELERYRQARDEFIRVGVAHPPGSDLSAWAKQVTPELLKIVSNSKQFTPAYRTLLGAAQSVAERDPRLAYAMLMSLENVAPEFSEARQLAQRIFGS